MVGTKEQREVERMAIGSFIFHLRGVLYKVKTATYHCGDRNPWNLESRHQKAVLIKYQELDFVTGSHKTG